MSHDHSKSRVLSSLKPRREPFWGRVEKGLYVGYRKLESGKGTWIARLRDDDAKQKYWVLDGVREFDSACPKALEWDKAKGKGVEKFDATVAKACRTYVRHQRVHKSQASADDAEARFCTLVYAKPLAGIQLNKLRPTVLRQWLHNQIAGSDNPDEVRHSKVSANRNLAVRKAALNLAHTDELVATDSRWRPVKPFSDVDRRREGWLSLAVRRVLIAACPSGLAALTAC